MSLHVDSEGLRRLALQCASEAENLGIAEIGRKRLLKMHASLIALAENDDWLSGRIAPLHPGGTNMIMAGHQPSSALT